MAIKYFNFLELPKVMRKYINLGCGPVYMDSPDWLNLDFAPTSTAVQRANLLERLPLADESAMLVYTSHFVEHVPRVFVSNLFSECLRVLKPGGVLRLVVPDLENMAREYLEMRGKGEHDKADFVVLEIVDQCVRQVSGGELGKLYRKLGEESKSKAQPLMEYIRARSGEDFLQSERVVNSVGLDKLSHLVSALTNRIQRYWIRFWLLALPAAFRAQNVSLTAVGERHQWLWDFHQIKTELEAIGFTDVQRSSAVSSTVPNFPFYPLDIDKQGKQRKGAESMYVEARKPSNLAG